MKLSAARSSIASVENSEFGDADELGVQSVLVTSHVRSVSAVKVPEYISVFEPHPQHKPRAIRVVTIKLSLGEAPSASTNCSPILSGQKVFHPYRGQLVRCIEHVVVDRPLVDCTNHHLRFYGRCYASVPVIDDELNGLSHFDRPNSTRQKTDICPKLLPRRLLLQLVLVLRDAHRAHGPVSECGLSNGSGSQDRRAREGQDRLPRSQRRNDELRSIRRCCEGRQHRDDNRHGRRSAPKPLLHVRLPVTTLPGRAPSCKSSTVQTRRL